MKFQVVICITLSLLGAALSGPMENSFDGMIQQDIEAEDYDGMIERYTDVEGFDGMTQEDFDYDGMTQEYFDYDGIIQQDADYDGEVIQQDVDYNDDLIQAIEEEDDVQIEAFDWKQYVSKLLPTPFYRYWKSAGTASDHFYTTNPNEIGTVTAGKVGKYGYKSQGVTCRMYRFRVRGSVPLYRYYRGGPTSNHYYTTNAGVIGTTTPGKTGKYGYRSEGIAGYCFPKKDSLKNVKLVPLFQSYSPALRDHFYTTTTGDILTESLRLKTKYGYTRVACYVLPAK